MPAGQALKAIYQSIYTDYRKDQRTWLSQQWKET